MRYNITVSLATDLRQLIIMLIGLLRSRREWAEEAGGFIRYLYMQVGGVDRVVIRVPRPLTMTMMETALLVGLDMDYW